MDGIGFISQAAGWVWLPEPEEWRFYAISPLLDEMGPRWAYGLLLKAYAQVDHPPGVVPYDICVAGLTYPPVSGLPLEEQLGSEKSGTTQIGLYPDGKGFFYRLWKEAPPITPQSFERAVAGLRKAA